MSGDAIQVYEMDGTTVVDSIDFGTAIVDPFGFSSTPTHKVVVKNLSNVVVTVEVTGDRADNLLPVFGPTELDLKPAPNNAFTLQPSGQSGDTTMGWVGLELLTPNTGSRTTTITFRAAPLLISVAVECKTGSGNCDVPTESAFKIEEVIESDGGDIADVVDGSEIDTLAELTNYDVVIMGGTGFPGHQDYTVFQTALKQWVQSGGGVVAAAWASTFVDVELFNAGGLADILPVTGSTAVTNGGTITITGDTSHPVTNGIANFTSPQWNDYGPLKPGATILATDSGGNPAVAVWTVGAGRVVYLSPIYFAAYSGYTNEPLLDGTIPDAVNLFLQAVQWASGSGPSGPLSQPSSPSAAAPPLSIAPFPPGSE